MNPIGIILLVAGIWFVGNALVMKTANVLASLFFKVVPFFLGLACLWAGAKSFGWI